MEQTGDLEPVRYRLLHVIYHQGESMRSGHYAAGITSSKAGPARPMTRGESRPLAPQWFCNDGVVKHWSEPKDVENKLTINPLNWSNKDTVESDYNPRILWYVRDSVAVQETESVERVNVELGGIAARMKKNSRRDRAQRA
ncbi:hypothetical protein DE146DRAFT_641669 [Phaeosphaeria sp. MPI-PUGE-AT-0046c]|nr:hypothetical protein DE146DRAFT_641669 [Phaeosphaeria sp. MPI-PUGE-AT-0046c]